MYSVVAKVLKVTSGIFVFGSEQTDRVVPKIGKVLSRLWLKIWTLLIRRFWKFIQVAISSMRVSF